MKNQSVDELVTEWQDKVTLVSRNIAELTETEAAKRIRNRMRGLAQPAYTGLTLEQARAAYGAVDRLLADFQLLESVCSHAADLHRRNSIFRSTEDEVREMLLGASVRLPVTHIPLNQRGLLDASVQADAATPEQMLQAMLNDFDIANSIIGEIDAAESAVDTRVANFQTETSALKAWAAKVGLAEIQQACEGLDAADSDPLQAAASLDAIESRFDQWRLQLEAAEKAQAALRESLERAQTSLQQLEDLANRSRLAIEETNRSIAGHHSYMEPTSREALDSHRAWLLRLDESATAGRWKAVQVGLSSFEASLEARMKVELKTYTQNRRSLDAVTDLKGRFDALRFKAKAYSERGILLAVALPGIQANIENALKQPLIDVQLLDRLVNAYDTALLATSRNGK
jgi:hypothetical protein